MPAGQADPHAEMRAEAELAEAIPDGQIPGPQNWELLARHLRRELGTRIHDLNRLLGAFCTDTIRT